MEKRVVWSHTDRVVRAEQGQGTLHSPQLQLTEAGPSAVVFSPSLGWDLCFSWGTFCPWLHCHCHRGPRCVIEDLRDLGMGETVFSFLHLAIRVSQKAHQSGSPELKIHSRGPAQPRPGLLPPWRRFLDCNFPHLTEEGPGAPRGRCCQQ